MKKNTIIIGVILIALVAYFVITKYRSQAPEKIPQVVVAALQQTASTSEYEIAIDIQPTGVKTVDVNNAIYAELSVAQIMSLAETQKADAPESQLFPYMLRMTSQKYPATRLSMESQVITNYQYTGGAHGSTTYTTWTFDAQTGETFDIKQIMQNTPEATGFLFTQVKEALKAKDQTMTQDMAWITEGSGTNLDNYSKFYISDDGITFIFEEYQIAPYAVGPVFVSVSWDDLEKYVRGGFHSILWPTEEESEITVKTSPTSKINVSASNITVKAQDVQTATSTN